MSSTPLHQFDVKISKCTEKNSDVCWNAIIDKSSFPNIIPLKNDGANLFQLDENKYKNSFSLFLKVFGKLPSTLFDYSVFVPSNSNEIIISGLTETTVRVAIVDLMTNIIPNANVKMVRPPINFRVYAPTPNNDIDVSNDNSLFNIFGETGDY